MSDDPATYATLDDWIAREAVPFSPEAPATFDAAVDGMVASLGSSVEILGLGEALHGGEEILVLRNRLFRRLAEAHGYTAVAIESSFPRGRLVDDFVAGRGPSTSFDALRDAGFSHGMGALDANWELVEWMRAYNADLPAGRAPLRFYGFDSPTEMMHTDSPRQLLAVALDYLAAVDPARAAEHRPRIDELIGADADWETPAAAFDPGKSVGRSPAAAALRVETEELISALRVRRPEWVAKSDAGRYLEAEHCAAAARHLLNYHAAVATPSDDRVARLLGLRDLMMADNLAYAAARERGRGGKILAFAHNKHLQRGPAQWQLGPTLMTWWPAGADLAQTFGPRYAAIGLALGWSEDNGLARPEPATLEARLTAAPGPARLVPIRPGLPTAGLPTRSAAAKNPTYFPLTAGSLTDFDWLLALDSTTYTRGGPPLP